MKHLSIAILIAALGAFPAAAATEDPFVDVAPYAGRKRLDKSLVTRTDNPDGTIDFDFRRAFAAGADKVRLTSRPFPLKEYRGRDFALVGEWSGALGKPAMLESRPSGPRADGTFWFSSCGANPLSVERRHNQCCAGIPNGLKKLYVNFDFTAPGEGLVRFYGYRHGHADILVSDAADDDAPPRLLFSASFEDGAAADTASGKVEPLASSGLEFVPGRKGQAVKLSKAAKSSLRYAAQGHVDWRRGTIAFWAKRAFGKENSGLGIDGKSLYHPFFALPSDPAVKAHARAPQHGDASLWFSWNGQFLSFTRGDATLNRVIRGIPYLSRLGSRDWCHYVITWDAYGQRVYLDGKDVRGVPGDNANPYMRVSQMPDRLVFAPESHRKLGSFFVGSGPGGCVDGLIDEFRVYSAPMSADEVRRLYNADSGGQEKSFNGWILPWAAESPLPENAAILGGDADGRGVPEGMELFEEVSPAALAKSGDGSRFRSAGQWKTGVFDGLEYLETGKGMNDRYAIRFTVPSEVPLWVFEVTFPDDVARSADISVQNARTGAGNYSLNHGYETGIEHPHTRTNIVQRFLYWTSAADRKTPQADLAFVVMSTWHDEPAAVSRVRLYSVRSGKLPDARIRDAAPVAGRRRSFTLRFEDPAVMYDLGVGQDTASSARLEFDRLAAYMKFTGADTLMYPAVWYRGNINDNYMPRTHVPHYLKEMCARFERDGLSLVPTVNQQWFIDFRDPKDVKSLYDGSLHATPISILSTGLPNMGGWHYSPTYYNISHPDVQRRLLEEFDQILDECAEFRSFKGVSIDLFNQINVMWWGSDRAGYNDYSVDMFRKAENVDVPKFTGAFRGRDYAKWLRANAWEAWLDWRCDVVADLYARFAARLAARRPDLTLYVAAYSRQRGKDGVAFRDDIDDPALVRKMLRECGIDGDRLARIPNLSLGIQSTSAFARDELRRDGTIPEDRKAKTRDLPETPGFYAEARKTAYPFALFSDSYYETAIGAPADGNGKYRGDGRLYGDWLKKEFSWRVSHINAAGREALRPFAKALKDGDMLCFAKGAFLISLNGMEDVLVPWMREFRKIPAVQFKDEKGNWPEAVKLRTAEVDGHRHAYVVNTSFEPVEVDLGRFGKLRLDSYELRYLR